jgi:inner membrane organizing system protein 1
MSASSSSSVIPNCEKWDHSVENFVRKTATGFAAGVGAALLCRTSIGRATAILFGAGFGAGIAYNEARYLFDYDICFDRRHVVSVGFYKPHGAATE